MSQYNTVSISQKRPVQSFVLSDLKDDQKAMLLDN